MNIAKEAIVGRNEPVKGSAGTYLLELELQRSEELTIVQGDEVFVTLQNGKALMPRSFPVKEFRPPWLLLFVQDTEPGAKPFIDLKPGEFVEVTVI